MHAKTIFIALSGKKQVGKDTTVGILVPILEAKGKKVVVTSFAEPLKRMCVEILGISNEGAYGTNEQKNSLCHIQWDGFPEEIRLKYADLFILARDGVQDPLPRTGPMTNREVMQVIGTDIFRAIHNNVWAQAPFNKDWQGIDVVILSDCRFPNEKTVTEDAGGLIIRLERKTGLEDNHPSETSLDGFTFENTYQNDGTLEDLEKYIREFCDKYGI